MKRVNFVLDDASIEILQRLKKEKKKNFSEIVRRAVKFYDRAYQKIQ